MIDKVVVIGSINYDNFLKVPHLVAEGENLHATSIIHSIGGKGSNQAVQCAKLGLETYMVGAVGRDSIGDEMIESMKNAGVDVRYVKRVDTPSGQAFVFSSVEGKVQGVVVKGANWEVGKEYVDEVLPLIDMNTYVVLQMEIPMETIAYAIEKSYEKGARVVLNAAPANKIEKSLFKLTYLSVFNESEASYYLGEKLSTLSSIAVGCRSLNKNLNCPCLVTAGEDGAFYSNGDIFLHVPAVKCKVVETTGAGDSFIGGCIYGFIKEMGVEETLKFATKCSSATIGKEGSQSAMPFLKEL